MFDYRRVPSGHLLQFANLNLAIEFLLVFPVKMLIFHSYVSLPEGMCGIFPLIILALFPLSHDGSIAILPRICRNSWIIAGIGNWFVIECVYVSHVCVYTYMLRFKSIAAKFRWYNPCLESETIQLWG